MNEPSKSPSKRRAVSLPTRVAAALPFVAWGVLAIGLGVEAANSRIEPVHVAIWTVSTFVLALMVALLIRAGAMLGLILALVIAAGTGGLAVQQWRLAGSGDAYLAVYATTAALMLSSTVLGFGTYRARAAAERKRQQLIERLKAKSKKS